MSLDEWLCMAAAVGVLIAPFALALVLRQLIKWDDRRREKIRSRRGFEVNDVKTNTGGSPVSDTERETNNG